MQLIALILAPLLLFGSLIASMVTNDGRWFFVLYPMALMLLGAGDPKPRRGVPAFFLGSLMFLFAIVVVVSSVKH